MEKLVITGLGPLSPIGTGKIFFWDSVMAETSGMRKITKLFSLQDRYGGEMSDINLDEYISDKRFRRAADISKYAMFAVKLAIEDAGIGIADTENLGMIFSLTHGALNYTQSYHRLLITEGADAASPMLFSDSVLNAPAGNTSIYFNIKGPVHTLVGSTTTTIKAIDLASNMIAHNNIDKAIIVAAEELNEISFLCYSLRDITSLSEGAGAVVIEKNNNSLKAAPYCYISGMASLFIPSDPETAIREVIKLCIKKADLEAEDINLIVTDSQIPDKLFMNDIPVGNIIHLTGNAFTVTTIWHIIIASMIIKNGEMPKTIIKEYSINNTIKNVLICSTDKQGTAAALILSKSEK